MTAKKTRRNLTTGELARAIGVAPKTVSQWFDSGKLRGWRFRGEEGGDRRIPLEEAIRFLKQRGIPLSSLLVYRVLLIGIDPRLTEALGQSLTDVELETAPCLFAAGILLERDHPQTIVVDLGCIGRTEGMQVAVTLRSWSHQSETALIGLATEDEPDTRQLTACGYSDVFRYPFDPDLLAQRIETLRG